MDKLKTVIAAFKKHLFWLLCAVAFLVPLACWWPAINHVVELFKTQRDAIEADFRNTNIPATQPNPSVTDKIREQRQALSHIVYGKNGEWDILYQEQKKHMPFPTEALLVRILSNNLKTSNSHKINWTIGIWNATKTPSRLISPPCGRSSKTRPRGGGQLGRRPSGGLKLHHPQIAERSKRPAASTHSRREHEEDWLVRWNDSDFNELKDQFRWRQTPTTFDIVLAQEAWFRCALARHRKRKRHRRPIRRTPSSNASMP